MSVSLQVGSHDRNDFVQIHISPWWCWLNFGDDWIRLSAAFNTVNHGILLDRLRTSIGLRHIYLTEHSTFASVTPRRPLFLSMSGSHRGRFSDPSCLPHALHRSDISLSTYVAAFISTPMTCNWTRLKSSYVAINCLDWCSSEQQLWFWNNDLLNADKLEVVYFGTRQWLQRSDLPSTVLAAGCGVAVSDTFTMLIVKLDSALTFNHVNDIVKAFSLHTLALRHLRWKSSSCIFVTWFIS